MQSMSGEYLSFSGKLWREFAGSERRRLKDFASPGMHYNSRSSAGKDPTL